MDKGSSPIEKFYEGQTIFMTGGTGFLGKVMIEKLLLSCPGIEKIYVLIRHKKGNNKSQRLAKIKECQAFQALRDHNPKRLDKLEALEGDLEQPGLGISPTDLDLLKEVNIVLNLAATINFKEELKTSLAVNVLATKALLEMCLTMRKLKSFVHVSTAYANCDREYTEERVYPSPVDLDELLRECERCSSAQELEELTKRVLLGKRPNTYTLTKAMAENVVEEYKTKFPVAIVRPSIVTAALRHPYPGWVDCRTGATGLIAGFGSGLLRIVFGDEDIILDMVPVDLVNNTIIAVAWKTARNGLNGLIVYNVTSGKCNPIHLGKMIEYVVVESRKTPQDTVAWYPSATATKNRLFFNISDFWMHLLPAYLHDILAQSSSERSLVKVHSRIRNAAEVLEIFMSNTYHFADGNIWRLQGEMSEKDRVTFYCDIKEVSWGHYTGVYTHGVRKYLLGQADDTLPQAKRRMRMFWLMDKTLKLLAAGGVYYLIFNIFRIATIIKRDKKTVRRFSHFI